MGAIKTYNYTMDERDISLIARGMAHPARVRIMKELQIRPYRNIDFCQILRMNKTSVKEHLDKLIDAKLVHVEYLPHFYLLSLNTERVEVMERLMASLM